MGGGGSDAHVWRALTPTTPSTVPHSLSALTTTKPSSSASEPMYAAASTLSCISQDHSVGAGVCVYVFYSSFSPGGKAELYNQWERVVMQRAVNQRREFIHTNQTGPYRDIAAFNDLNRNFSMDYGLTCRRSATMSGYTGFVPVLPTSQLSGDVPPPSAC